MKSRLASKFPDRVLSRGGAPRPNRLCRFALLLSLFAMVTTASAQPDEQLVGSSDFRQIIERAKLRVYPALIFVKPIKEEFSRGEKRRAETFGSGVIISAEGLAVTNNHVIDKAIDIRVVLSDKRQVPAKLIGKDPETDLALLQIQGLNESEKLPFGEFADSSKVDAGDFVMALGSPFGYARSISLGIVSNTERYLGYDTKFLYNNFIQTDAAINPGNSGGPLINVEGKIIGINTLKLNSGQGLGFSVPSNVAKDVARRLREYGRVDRSWTGLKLQPLRDYYSNTFTKADTGVLIRHVEPDSPAAKAGLRAGDILLAVLDRTVAALYAEDLPEVERVLADLRIGKEIELKARRGNSAVQSFTIVPKQKGSIELADFSCERWNMTVKEFSEFSDPDLFFYEKGGVYVNATRNPGNAARSGLRRRDILLRIDNKAVKTINDVKEIYQRIVNDERRRPRVLVEIRRGALRQPLVLDYKEDFSK